MKSKKNQSVISSLFQNNLFVLLFSLVSAVVIWLLVVINVSSQTTRVIKDVKVTIDQTVPSQFGLEVFGESEFTVDVTVTGKKYQISTANLSKEDIEVVAVTNNVDSAGFRTLQLMAEPVSESASYTISSISSKTIDVYFDTEKTVQFVIEPDIVTDGFPIVKDGYSCGDINLSDTTVSITGPSTQVNKVEKVVARCELVESLTSNMSVETELLPLDDTNKSDFDYLSMSVDKVVLTIPVLRVKELDTVVTFKNAPDTFVINPLKYTVSRSRDSFNILVDEYDKTTEYSVGTIDFKELSPTNNTFTFAVENTAAADKTADDFTVEVDMSDFTQEYITYPADKIKVNNPDNAIYKISELNKSLCIVGKESALKDITADSVTVEVDLSDVELSKGQSVSVPVIVTVNSQNCWAYGTYSVEVTLR